MNVSETNTKTNPSKIVESIVLPVKTRELIPRACNLPHKTQYLITKANGTYKARKYNQNTQENTFEPETNNMHFIFTNFNGKTHGEYSKPSFDQDKSSKATSIIQECSNTRGILYYDNKIVWVAVPFKAEREWRNEINRIASRMKITLSDGTEERLSERQKVNGSREISKRMVTFSNQNHAQHEKIQVTNAYTLMDFIQIIEVIRKNIRTSTFNQVRSAILAYYKSKDNGTKTELIDVLSRYAGNKRVASLWEDRKGQCT